MVIFGPIPAINIGISSLKGLNGLLKALISIFINSSLYKISFELFKDFSIIFKDLRSELILSEGLSKFSIPCHFLFVLIAPDPRPKISLPFEISSISIADIIVDKGLLTKPNVTALPILILFVIEDI